VSLAELHAYVARVGVADALDRIPAWRLPLELTDLRWAWIVAHYAPPKSGFYRRDVCRAWRALHDA
jgi:hypothetical protein